METSEVTTLKLGMWLEFLTLFKSEFVFVHAISDGYASLSGGLTATVNGALVDPANGYIQRIFIGTHVRKSWTA